MRRNGSSGTDRLADTVRAAGFAMATPDDAPDVSPGTARQSVEPTPPAVISGGWQSAVPSQALVPAKPLVTGYQGTLREWMAALTWRAPA